MTLQNTVEIAGEVVNKERYGMASIHDENKTFTGNVLFKSEIRTASGGYSYDDSIETSFENTAQVNGLTVWKSNGAIPFADMLLDFVQIGAITLDQAEFSTAQRQKDETASLSSLVRGKDGGLYLAEDSLNYRDERLAQIAKMA
tara:strand:+ start:77 stop:508 length:432 start_codon:yes stop_codon:yes gene_type:complete